MGDALIVLLILNEIYTAPYTANVTSDFGEHLNHNRGSSLPYPPPPSYHLFAFFFISYIFLSEQRRRGNTTLI